jgi:methionyl-tRNA formyltransferase
MQRAILDGKPVTGITTMYMAAGLDTGDMLLRGELPITLDDNFETVHDKLGVLGADLLVQTVDGLAAFREIRKMAENGQLPDLTLDEINEEIKSSRINKP